MLFYVVWALEKCVRCRSHCSVFVMMHFCCIKATLSHYSVLYKNEEKNIRFCAFTLLQFREAHYWILERFKILRFCAFSLIKCVFKNLLFCGNPLLIDNVFKNLRFCRIFVQISVNTFTKTDVFLSDVVQKRNSVNGA